MSVMWVVTHEPQSGPVAPSERELIWLVRVRVEEELRVVGSRAIAYEGAGAGER